MTPKRHLYQRAKDAAMNEPIADFMGYEKEYHPSYTDVYNNKVMTWLVDIHWLSNKQLKFHCSLEWQFKVIEKIQSLGYSCHINLAPKNESVYIRKEGKVFLFIENNELKTEQMIFYALHLFVEKYNQLTEKP